MIGKFREDQLETSIQFLSFGSDAKHKDFYTWDEGWSVGM